MQTPLPIRALLTVLSTIALVRTGNIRAAEMFTQKFDSRSSVIQIGPPDRYGLFRESDRVSIETSRGEKVRVFTLRGKKVYEGAPGRLPPLPVNHYFVETDGDRSQFAVLPADYAGASFLGTEADNGTDSQLTGKMTQIRPAWVRVMGEGYWIQVQPKPNTWNWKPLDRVVEVNQGRKIIVMAATRPSWVTDEGFFREYARYLRAMARRYAGKIYAIEVWNEPWYESPAEARLPDVHDADSLVDQYIRLLKTSRNALLKEHSKVKLFGPAFSYPLYREVERFVQRGAAPLVDAFTWHDYRANRYAPDQDYPNLPSVDKTADKYRALLGGTPLIVDELGVLGNSALGIENKSSDPVGTSNADWHRGMCRAIKLCVMYRAVGVEALIPHVFALFGQVPRNNNLALFGWDASSDRVFSPRGPHPKTSAFLMTCHRLNKAKLLGRRVTANGVFLYAWQAADGAPFVIAWCRENQSTKLDLRATDIFGCPLQTQGLGEEPVMIRFETQQNPESALNLAAAATASTSAANPSAAE